MLRGEGRILCTHTGSLVRPPEIVRVMRAIDLGEPVDEASFQRDLARAVAEVVRQQAEAGIDIASDGEFGKRGWTAYVAERLGGVELRERTGVFAPGPGRDRDSFRDFYAEYDKIQRAHWLPEGMAPTGAVGTAKSWACVGPISYRGQDAVQRDIVNLKSALQAAGLREGFLPVAAPGSAAAGRVNEYYSREEDFLYALADALREEYLAIADSGLLLQVDDAFLPTYYDSHAFQGDLDAYRAYARVRVEALNHALAGIPPERVRYHVCWGSWNGPHVSDVPLADIVDLILAVNAGAYSIEAANPRHEHEWQVWERVRLPEGKILIPGVVTHSTNIVEHAELVAWRLTNFARLVGRENVIGGTDCGFSQNWDLVRTHVSVQWAKLRSLSEGARLASERLWA